MLPVLYFTGGGLYSGMSSWFIFGMVYCFLLYKGKRFFIMTTFAQALPVVLVPEICAYLYGYNVVNNFRRRNLTPPTAFLA